MLPTHVREHLAKWRAEGHPEPQYVESLERGLKDARPFNLVYAVDEDLYVHIHEDEGLPRYEALEPHVNEARTKTVADVRKHAFAVLAKEDVPREAVGYHARLNDLIDRRLERLGVVGEDARAVRYDVKRKILGARHLEPLIQDPWIEDIHAIGLDPIWVVHKIFGPCQSSIHIKDPDELNHLLHVLSEGMGRPVSTARPIVDGALQDGSRINIVYGDDVSPSGSSFTIRKFSETPLSLTQLIAWGTMDEMVGAYLWLCMEYGMSVFVSGETASGKTTTLNALLPLVPPDAKILTAEDTPEVRPPHGNWQQLVTRDASEAGARVEMGDLLKVGLRSRPDRIIVGEIRGAEGAVAFQAMQTGYPTFATFHASSVGKLIQRFTSDPINVPPQFMPNLQVALVQLAVNVGGKRLRRVTEVEEIEAYSRRAKSPITRQVFRWDPVKDRHEFNGRNNSYVLEQLVAPKMGMANPRAIYPELDRRAAILRDLVGRAVFDYHETMGAYNEQRELEVA